MDFWDGFDSSITASLRGLSLRHFGEDIFETTIFDNDEDMREEFYGYDELKRMGW